jgi:hypothetical protein
MSEQLETKFIAYKIVAVRGNEQLFSVYDSSVEYEIGKLMVQKVQEGHKGGYYSCIDRERMMRMFYEGTLLMDYSNLIRVAVLECEVWGDFNELGNGMQVTTYLRPIRILELFDFTKTDLDLRLSEARKALEEHYDGK